MGAHENGPAGEGCEPTFESMTAVLPRLAGGFIGSGAGAKSGIVGLVGEGVGGLAEAPNRLMHRAHECRVKYHETVQTCTVYSQHAYPVPLRAPHMSPTPIPAMENHGHRTGSLHARARILKVQKRAKEPNVFV